MKGNKVKRIVLTIVFVLCSFVGRADNQLVTVVDTISGVFPSSWVPNGATAGGVFLAASDLHSYASAAVLIDWTTGKLEKWKDIRGVVTEWNGGILLLALEDDIWYNALFDPVAKTLKRVEFKGQRDPVVRMREYQNGQGIVEAIAPTGSEDRPSGAGLYDSTTGLTTPLVVVDKDKPDRTARLVDNWSDLRAVSPDKRTALFLVGGRESGYSEFAVVDLPSRRIAITFRETFTKVETLRAEYLTNNCFLQGPRESRDAWVLRDVTGKEIEKIRFPLLPDGGNVLWIKFSPTLERALALSDKGDERKQYLDMYFLDSSGLRGHLAERGLLFRQTSAVLNDSVVRVRENPNLEAKVVTTLNKGEQLLVVDRSGLTMAIGANNTYWYKVKTSAGTEGWVYGAYINLSKDTKQQ